MIDPGSRSTARPATRWGACALALAVCAGCELPGVSSAPGTVVRFSTGTPGAGFHPLGEALARTYRTAAPDMRIQVRESPGSVSNLEALQRGDAEIGLAFADVAYMAYAGRLASHRLDRLRGIAVLQLTPLHLVVREGAQITRIGDLRGRRVALGPPGSGTALTASLVLHAFGITEDQVVGEALVFNEAARRLVAGTLDAMFVNGSYPAESVRMATAAGAQLLPVHGDDIEELRHEYPFLRQTLLPGGLYRGHREAVRTIGVDSLLLCRDDLDDDLVYRITRTFFQVLPELADEQESLRTIDLEQVPATPIPLHPGAARYYRERELNR